MFRDYKTGGYNIEGTNLKAERLVRMTLLIALAYTSAIFKVMKFVKGRYRHTYLDVKTRKINIKYGGPLAEV